MVASLRGCRPLVTATCAEHSDALNLRRSSQLVDELAELSAGHGGRAELVPGP